MQILGNALVACKMSHLPEPLLHPISAHLLLLDLEIGHIYWGLQLLCGKYFHPASFDVIFRIIPSSRNPSVRIPLNECTGKALRIRKNRLLRGTDDSRILRINSSTRIIHANLIVILRNLLNLHGGKIMRASLACFVCWQGRKRVPLHNANRSFLWIYSI